MEKFEQSEELEVSKSSKEEVTQYIPQKVNFNEEMDNESDADAFLDEYLAQESGKDRLKQRNLVHYSKLSPEELDELKKIYQKQKVDFLSDQFTLIASKRTDNVHKERAIKNTLALFTPEATVYYNWKVGWQRKILRNLSINEFLHLIANWDIKADNLTSGGGLLEKSIRSWSPLLEPEVVDLSDGEKTVYKAKMSGIEIYDLSPERLANFPNLNSDSWDSYSNEMLTK